MLPPRKDGLLEMRFRHLTLAVALILSISSSYAQTTDSPVNPPIAPPATTGEYERRDTLPNINVYLPEGQASIRLRKLIRNVLFESQLDYRFVNGDISAYLRYKYYANRFTYRVSVFDTIGFPDIGSSSKNEFVRVRGGLVLFGLPRDYNNRYFLLLQDDRLTFGDLTNVDNKRNNIYGKISYQYGTQFDERLNGIVGESRGRITPVLTAFRDIGPQRTSLAVALTESGRVGPGDYKYTKFEAEGMNRLDITEQSFVYSRLHLGAFVGTERYADRANLPESEQFSIPYYELFQLGGREALRSINNTSSLGTHEIHLTNEFFHPIFRNKDFRTWLAHWNTMYGIGYLGAGTVAFNFRNFSKTENAVVDAGLGAETSITVHDYEVLLSVLYAHTLHAPDELKGSKVRFSIRTVR